GSLQENVMLRSRSMSPAAPLADAEGISFRIAQDRERQVGPLLRLDDGSAGLHEPFDLRLAIIRGEVEMHRVRLGPGLLAPVKVEARPAAVRRFHQVEAADVRLAHARGSELLEDRLVEVLVGPAERKRPESPQLSRLGTGKGDV